jgi:hypothetical protein
MAEAVRRLAARVGSAGMNGDLRSRKSNGELFCILAH